MLRSSSAWIDLLTGFPGQTMRILDRVEDGELEFQLNIPEIRHATRQFNQMANRIILAILVGSLTVSLALLIPSRSLVWPWILPTWLIVIGFVLMAMLSLWLIWSILRSNRR